VDNPLVTVIMAVYNGQRFLRPAIDSVVGQTFRDLELIVINDGSTDGTRGILESYDDPRMTAVHQDNMGQTAARNKGLALARGKYIAIQDADDISLQDRLAKQVAFLDSNGDCGLLGSWAYVISGDEEIIGTVRPRTSHRGIVASLAFGNQFIHSSVMFRDRCVQTLGNYDETALYAEDYEFALRISSRYRLANLPEYLVKWRLNAYTGIYCNERAEEKRYARQVRRKYWPLLLRSSTLAPTTKVLIPLSLPFTYLRYFFYRDITHTTLFRNAKRLAYLKAARSGKKATFISKATLLLRLPFMNMARYIRRHLMRKEDS
jgi:glycosyltransferase involved in cell wall biosynthesis